MEFVLPDELRYVAVEGVPGAGASRLAGLIARRLHARLVREEVRENPFLERFHEDRARWAFQTRLAFLVMRFRQQKVIYARDLFHRLTVADSTFDKDRIYAHACLAEDEITLYDRLYRIMEQEVPQPDLVVLVQSRLERAFDRIRQTEHRRELDPAYYADLHKGYTEYFFRYRKSPLLIINAEDFEGAQRPEDMDDLAHEIARVRRAGTTYFRPLSRSSQHMR